MHSATLRSIYCRAPAGDRDVMRMTTPQTALKGPEAATEAPEMLQTSSEVMRGWGNPLEFQPFYHRQPLRQKAASPPERKGPGEANCIGRCPALPKSRRNFCHGVRGCGLTAAARGARPTHDSRGSQIGSAWRQAVGAGPTHQYLFGSTMS